MSDQQVLTPPVGRAGDPSPIAFERWSENRVRAALTCDDAHERMTALSMIVSPESPVDGLVVEIVRCAGLSRDEPTALAIAATVLTQMRTPESKRIALDAMVLLVHVEMPMAVRLAAANGFWLYRAVPKDAWSSLAQMAFAQDALLRQVTFAAALPHAHDGAGALAAEAARVGVVGWTSEGLDLLAASAGSDLRKRAQVENYVVQSLQGTALVPAMIAAYSALARINPVGVAVPALAKFAGQAATLDEAKLALRALSQLGEPAKAAIPTLVAQLNVTNDSELEAALCETLLTLGIGESEVPIARVVERVGNGPDQAVVAHCMLLGLHGKTFTRVAPIVEKRFESASEGLRRVLDAVHEMLTGRPLLVAQPQASQ